MLDDCNRKESSREQKAAVWTTTDLPCSPAEAPEAWFDSIASQGQQLVFHTPFCSVLGRRESQVNRYHLKTAGAGGAGFLVTTVVCYKKGRAVVYGVRNVLTTTTLPSASVHICTLQWSIASKTPPSSQRSESSDQYWAEHIKDWAPPLVWGGGGWGCQPLQLKH